MRNSSRRQIIPTKKKYGSPSRHHTSIQASDMVTSPSIEVSPVSSISWQAMSELRSASSKKNQGGHDSEERRKSQQIAPLPSKSRFFVPRVTSSVAFSSDLPFRCPVVSVGDSTPGCLLAFRISCHFSTRLFDAHRTWIRRPGVSFHQEWRLYAASPCQSWKTENKEIIISTIKRSMSGCI